MISELKSGIEKLGKQSTLKKLSLRLMGRSVTVLPSLQSLKILEVSGGMGIQSIPLPTMTHLHQLKLQGCNTITDVGMLGGIPDLTIRFCCNITDISKLHDNQSVTLQHNSQIMDYSNCFTNSIKITLIIDGLVKFSFSKWQKVQHLSLTSSEETNITFISEGNIIPRTVKRLTLAGSFNKVVNWQDRVQHLTELSLFRCKSIVSLTALRLNTVPVVTLGSLPNLNTLEGLGLQNKIVKVNQCDSINDFSYLGNVLCVIIDNCQGFKLPFDSNSVAKGQKLIIEQNIVKNPYF